MLLSNGGAMDWTADDLANIKAAIIAKATGIRKVGFSSSDKSVNLSDATLKELLDLKNIIEYARGLADGTYSPRTYAKQGGRGR